METSATGYRSKCFFIDTSQYAPHSEYGMDKVREVFVREIQPIYGNQKAALQKIEAAKDRKCYFLCDESKELRGILVYKTGLSNEFKRFGITDSLEIKTLSVVNGGDEVAERLIKKVQKVARKCGALSMHVTVNDRSTVSLESFQRFEFMRVKTFLSFQDREEHLLKRSVERRNTSSSQEVNPIEGAIGRLSLNDQSSVVKPRFAHGRIKVVGNVHQDDIHGIIKLSDQTFITGSKDGAIKKWDFDGQLNKAISEPKRINYRNWVTALTPLDNQSWISGTRNGNAYLWNNEGDFISDLNVRHGPFPESELHCKQRNIHRINCLTSFHEYIPNSYFAGWPTQFTEHSVSPPKRIGYTYTSQSDWVYAIQPVTEDSLLVITGCRLDLIRLSEDRKRWEMDFTLVGEDEKRGPRPFISAITPLQESHDLYGLAVFDGSVRVVDLEKSKILYQKAEHRNRVWTIENITRSCFASCGDDGFIKLWDMRQARSLLTVRDNTQCKARVSILKLLKDNLLLSGSCPDDVKHSKFKAQFSYWDIRKMSTHE